RFPRPARPDSPRTRSRTVFPERDPWPPSVLRARRGGHNPMANDSPRTGTEPMPNTFIRLRGVSPELKDRSWESDRLLRIGRSLHLEVLLDDSSISRRHAEIALSEAGWV